MKPMIIKEQNEQIKINTFKTNNNNIHNINKPLQINQLIDINNKYL